MKNQRAALCFFAYVALAMAAMLTLRADERSLTKNAVPDGEAGLISDWALAGVIWSDASLTRKLASEALKRAESAEQIQQLQAIANRSSEIVGELESFGWKQVRRLDAATRANVAERAGVDDLGRDDERASRDLNLNLDQYRVIDDIDQTPADVPSREEAVRDAVQGAITAAAGRRGMERPGIGHISVREGQTLSATLPFSQDSIYDSDDYDPDVDYHVENPQGTSSSNPMSVERSDRDDVLDRGDPAGVIEDEDDLISALGSEERVDARRSLGSVEMDRYTSERSSHLQDANWVQFHLNANQATWREFTTRENVMERTGDAMMKLKTDASVAINATANSQLKAILQSIGEMPTSL